MKVVSKDIFFAEGETQAFTTWIWTSIDHV